MTVDTVPDERVPFVACLRHETRKTFRLYAIFMAKVALMLGSVAIVALLLVAASGLIAAVWEAIVYIVALILGGCWFFTTEMVMMVVGAFWHLVSLIPWWGYIVLAAAAILIVPPVVYATGVCVRKRYGIDVKRTVMVIIEAYGSTAGALYICGAVLYICGAVERGASIASTAKVPSLLEMAVMLEGSTILTVAILGVGTIIVLIWATAKTVKGIYPYKVGAGEFAAPADTSDYDNT